ncbi:hypothetical protein QRZ34_28985 [Klebsiella michiganensis]|uniref:hypothetical protein n=1 Tax=Klebsiella michiganensis TaxID=1134687 RepID=UPI00256FC433|nr:hypothetical protein [Klebsiella michiganensis]MDL4455020.1 hypothetical protein [Klebsiella michiganensis]
MADNSMTFNAPDATGAKASCGSFARSCSTARWGPLRIPTYHAGADVPGNLDGISRCQLFGVCRDIQDCPKQRNCHCRYAVVYGTKITPSICDAHYHF